MPRCAPGVPPLTKSDLPVPPPPARLEKKVYVLGVGLHPFGRFPDKDYGELRRIATTRALQDAGVPWHDIHVMYATAFTQAASWGTKIANAMGARGIPVINMEAACCSTSAAIAQATYAISSGAFDLAICVGGEKPPMGSSGLRRTIATRCPA